MPATPATATRPDQSLQEELLDDMFRHDADLDETVEAEAVVDAPAPTAEQASSNDDSPTEPDASQTTPVDDALPTDPFLAERAELQRQLAGSTRLPPAIRQQLSQAVQRAQWNQQGAEQPALSVSEAISWLEEALPRQFSLEPEAIESPAHPTGDIFFSGQVEALNDQQAAQVAAEQLAATGFAPAT